MIKYNYIEMYDDIMILKAYQRRSNSFFKMIFCVFMSLHINSNTFILNYFVELTYYLKIKFRNRLNMKILMINIIVFVLFYNLSSTTKSLNVKDINEYKIITKCF